MVLESSYSYGVNIISRDPILPLPSPPFFAPFLSLPSLWLIAPTRYESIALRALLPYNAFVYINSSIALSIESIVYSQTYLQLQLIHPRAPIAVPTLSS